MVKRSAGILLPISSLPGPYGIGSLGSDAYAFADFLSEAGQTFWQVLPIGPTGFGDSPYQPFSCRAGNPYFIDIGKLREKGLLSDEEESGAKRKNEASVDYGDLYENRLKLLRQAFLRFDTKNEEYVLFKEREGEWLEDYALFMSLKKKLGMKPLCDWEEAYRLREKKAMEEARRELSEDIEFRKFLQFEFFLQWFAFKEYAESKGIKIIGDVPIYVSPDSADLWSEPELFEVSADDKRPKFVSGCPPDAFAPLGQLWGNPLYNWKRHEESGFAWWIKRLKAASRIFGAIRIDHFRAFESYYAISSSAADACNGKWEKGPGERFISAVKASLPGTMIIAEDLGYLTEEVKELRKKSGFPGMKVLQFAFDPREESDYLPHNYSREFVVYTGTHDNTTCRDWEKQVPYENAEFARKYMSAAPEEPLAQAFIRTALASVCMLAIIPMQDYLGLGASARMNTPGLTGGNWRWRIKEEQLTAQLTQHISELSRLYARSR